VKKLPHAHYFKIDLKGGRRALPATRWYDLRKELKEPFRDAADYRDMFTSAVGLRLRSDVPLGVCLSGGLDSSSIVSTMAQAHGRGDVHTFSAVYGQGLSGDESGFINLYRDQLPNMHFVQPDETSLMRDVDDFLTAQYEPVPSTSTYAQYKVMDLARQHVTVTLDGQGADEQLAGYHYFFGFHFKNLLRQGKIGQLSAEMGYYLSKHRALFGLKSFLFFLLPA
ncbi:asparagine synthase-related protein, partial [Arthrospira platensis SPKY1]|nr:asparagine synthase-related protein [Arthrospira platensis SPKY1]